MSYNPFTAALTAATSELTSPAARRYYVRRSQQDIQTVLILVIELACMAFELGSAARQWVDEVEQSAQAQPAAPGALVLAPTAALVAPMVPVQVVAISSAAPAALPAFTPIALLNPAPKPKRTRKPAAPKSPAKATEAPAKRKGGRKPKTAAPAA